MLKALWVFFRSYPFDIILWKIKCKVLNIKISEYNLWQTPLENKNGIEIGGPSSVFKSSGYLPLYHIINSLDGVNFSSNTIWEGKLSQNEPFKYENKFGKQFIGEGSDLGFIENEKYDFVLSCNNLEHIANPVKALFEWKRLIKKGGHILLILPNKVANFDHKRTFTEFEHFITDYKNNIDESDLTHLSEVLELHDLKRDVQAGSLNSFQKRCRENLENRCIHHHVFSINTLEQLLTYCEISTVLKYTSKTDIFIMGKKIS